MRRIIKLLTDPLFWVWLVSMGEMVWSFWIHLYGPGMSLLLLGLNLAMIFEIMTKH